jgi:hypothetical protein
LPLATPGAPRQRILVIVEEQPNVRSADVGVTAHERASGVTVS